MASESTARPAKARPARRAKGGRRDSAAVDAFAAKFLACVKANDGRRLEAIPKGLGIRSHDPKLPAQTLPTADAVKTAGQKRGTRYHVAAGGKA